jgi:hypothetical protein
MRPFGFLSSPEATTNSSTVSCNVILLQQKGKRCVMSFLSAIGCEC